MSEKKLVEDFMGVNSDVKFNGHGKNFKPLVAAGAWEISGFHYGRSKCACCGRPITRVLHLKNKTHEAAVDRDPNYSFPEEIGIGIVCGPKLFMESCIGFYNDVEKEWVRQWAAWKDFVNFVILCTQNRDIWEMIPEEYRTPIDHYIEVGWKGEETTGKWWRLRDAKKRVLKTKRNAEKLVNVNYLVYNVRSLIFIAKSFSLVDQKVSVKQSSTVLEIVHEAA